MRILLILLTTVLIFLSSCMKDLEDVTWDINLLAPVLKSSVSIRDFVRDGNIQTGEADSLFFIYRNKLASFRIDTSLLGLDVKPFKRNIKLDSIKLNNQTIEQSVTLGEIITEAGIGFLIPDGSTTTIPAMSGINIGPFDVDGSNYFQTITLQEGTMRISVTNNFPVGITNITYEIVNKISGDQVHSGSFPNVDPGEIQVDSVDLSGKTIEGQLVINLTSDIPGSATPVQINYSDDVKVAISIEKMRIYEAKAIFPAQTIINHKEVVYLEDMEDREIKYAFINGGKLRIRVVSTIEEQTYFTYLIPNATRNGEIFREEITCPPAPPGGSINKEFIYEFDGYDFDFTGLNGDTINAFYNEVLGRIDSTGKQVFLTLADSVDLIVEVLDIKPKLAKGYFGSDTFQVALDTTDFVIFKNLIVDSFNLAKSNISLSIDNSQGIEGAIHVNNLATINSQNSQMISLDKSMLPLPLHVKKPAFSEPVVSSHSMLLIDEKNSNPEELIGNLPDKILYDLTIITNPAGNIGERNDFIFADNEINAYVDIEVPLQFQTPGIKLTDTISWINENVDSPEQIKEGSLNFIIGNGFPVEANVNLFFMDDKSLVFDSLISHTAILAAPVDPINHQVIEKRVSELQFFIPEKRMPAILDAKAILVEVYLKTKPGQTHLQFFDTYNLDVSVVGDFVYHVQKINL